MRGSVLSGRSGGETSWQGEEDVGEGVGRRRCGQKGVGCFEGSKQIKTEHQLQNRKSVFEEDSSEGS